MDISPYARPRNGGVTEAESQRANEQWASYKPSQPKAHFDFDSLLLPGDTEQGIADTGIESNNSTIVKKTFPFLAQYSRGKNIKLLHHVGPTAIAQVWDEVGAEPYYLLRHRDKYAKASDHSSLRAAFAELRAANSADAASEQQLFTPNELAAALQLTPAKWIGFCDTYDLLPNNSYTRQQVRKSITAKRGKLTGHYISLLSRIESTTTNAA